MRLIDADELKDTLIEVLERIRKNPKMTKDEEHIIRTCAMMGQMIDDMQTMLFVPMDFHERCLGLEVKRRIKAEEKLKLAQKTNRRILENYRPVVHVHWREDSHGYNVRCTACGYRTDFDRMSPFCPQCGAKMDEEANE